MLHYVIKSDETLSVRLKDGVPAAHNDGSPEETQQQKQEGLQPGEGDVTLFCRCGLWFVEHQRRNILISAKTFSESKTSGTKNKIATDLFVVFFAAAEHH